MARKPAVLVYGVQGSCENYRRALTAAGIPAILAPPNLRMQSAWGVARAALEQARANKLVSGAELTANYLRLSHAKGEETLYAHMQYLYVRTGEVVKAGEPIGTVGQTGRATGAHLHLEWLCNGIRYDPAGIFNFL